MDKRISPASRLEGSVLLPGDKSVSHRYAMISAIAEGKSKLHNYSTGADCQSTLYCLRGLGIEWTKDGNVVEIEGRGLDGLRAPLANLDAGNSGSTIRMISGILAAQPFTSTLEGDESLSRRPMERVMKPLREMGANLEARDGKYPPLTIHGGPLKPIEYTLPVASAQVKSCVLLAGLFAPGATTVNEAIVTRDHTELALREFGAEVTSRRGAITVQGRPTLTGKELLVPGDISSSAFFLVAACIIPGSRLLMRAVGLNPTRTALIDFLVAMGAKIRVVDVKSTGGELVGNIEITGGDITGGTIEGATTAALIDEIPVLAVLGARSRNGLTVKDASELRVKETDRIATVADNFQRMGVTVETAADGFHIPGGQKFAAAELDSCGDHRIAMAFSVAALAAEGDCTIHNAEAASVSYSEFFDTLHALRA
ncbi:MAG: 3-phosphoshikimate 1-carboxyvinyltransferase [Bryobacteraceae bacterium]|nr:3-phosphoshikimate 1-carboxyvinyltransferase [Bryobacteraceae bacterium]